MTVIVSPRGETLCSRGNGIIVVTNSTSCIATLYLSWLGEWVMVGAGVAINLHIDLILSYHVYFVVCHIISHRRHCNAFLTRVTPRNWPTILNPLFPSQSNAGAKANRLNLRSPPPPPSSSLFKNRLTPSPNAVGLSTSSSSFSFPLFNGPFRRPSSSHRLP